MKNPPEFSERVFHYDAAIMKCDKCENIATVHLTEVNAKLGTKIERHLCEACATEFDLPIPKGAAQELLDELRRKHGQEKPPNAPEE